MSSLSHWHFDFLSAVLALVVMPVFYFALRLVAGHIKSGIRYAIDGVVYFIARSLKQRLAWGLTLRRFCRLQIDRYQYLYVPASSETKVPLDTVFVTLRLESQEPARTLVSQGDLLETHKRIIVVGEPGSGKSSLVKWLFRDACRKAQRTSKSRFPVLLELKELQPPQRLKDAGPWLYKEIKKQVARSNVYQVEDCFENYSQTTGLLVLLDGLDEVSIQQYPRVESAIRGLARDLSAHGENNVLLLTMRSQFYQQVGSAYREDFGPTMRLEPFRPTDMYEFLAKWPFPSDREQMVTRIYKDLADRPSLRDLCRNPLILSMYVAEAQRSSIGISPESRTEFYSKVTEELIIKRRLAQKRGATAAPATLKEQRQRILGRLALQHLLDPSQPANLLQWSQAIEAVKEVVGCTAAKAVGILRDIEKETGIIEEERVGQTLRFIHLTFCEYMAAFEAVEGSKEGWSTLLAAHKSFRAMSEPQASSRLIEVIPFASGLLKRMDRAGAIGDLFELGDGRLLARSFLETKRYDHPVWASFVRSEEQALIDTPEAEWNEEWLQRLYLFNVVILDSMRSAEHLAKVERPLLIDEFFRRLVNHQVESLGTLLGAYALQDAAAAFRLSEVCGIDMAQLYPGIVVASCDQEAFLRLTMERSLFSGEEGERWLALLVEAALRSRVVANWLQEERPVDQLKERIEREKSKRYCWPYYRMGKSLLTQYLSVSLTLASPMTCKLLRYFQLLDPLPIFATRKSQFVAFIVLIATGFYLFISGTQGILMHQVQFLGLLLFLTLMLAWLVMVAEYRKLYESVVFGDVLYLATWGKATKILIPMRTRRLVEAILYNRRWGAWAFDAFDPEGIGLGY